MTLYALAIGMGIPLLFVAMFGNKFLPKAGAWMDRVKTFFGFVLIAAALFLLERMLSDSQIIWLWIVWGSITSGWIYHVSRDSQAGKLASVLGAIAIFGLASAASLTISQFNPPTQEQAENLIEFEIVKNLDELEEKLAQAKAAKQPVLLDHYADWCVACKEIEKYTFNDPKVADKLSSFMLLKVDMTEMNEQNIQFMQQRKILGLPTIDFWNANGEFVEKARVFGFIKSDEFLDNLSAHQLTP